MSTINYVLPTLLILASLLVLCVNSEKPEPPLSPPESSSPPAPSDSPTSPSPHHHHHHHKHDHHKEGEAPSPDDHKDKDKGKDKALNDADKVAHHVEMEHAVETGFKAGKAVAPDHHKAAEILGKGVEQVLLHRG